MSILLGFGGVSLFGLRPIDQLDEGHRRVVADAETHLQDARGQA
ncbi:MAG: hypothetical protein U1E72_06845 [Burkholderiaceae bacterium]